MSEPQKTVPPVGPYLQARLWASQAPPTERAFAGIVLAVVIGLVGWALVPGGSEEYLSTSPVLSDPGFAPVDADAEAIGSGGLPPSSDGELSTPQPIGGDDPGSSSTGGQRSLAEAQGTPARSGDAGGETGTVPLTASDRGVTPTAIRAGFVVLNLGGVEGAGIAFGLRSDARQAVDAFVAHANKQGGIKGRKIDPVVKTIDVVSEDDQRRKCLQFTQTDKVFAIVDTVGFLTEPTKACVTVENDTPLYTAVPGSAREISKAAPFQISPKKDHSRAVRDYVAAAKADGFFDPSRGFKRLGLVSDECELDTLADLKKALADVGVDNISEFRAPCDLAAQRGVGGPAVLQHNRDGVTHVFFGLANSAVTNYTDAARRANFYPKIFVSDWWTLSTDSSSEDFDPDVFDGARAVTATVDGDTAAGKPLPELTQKCSKILEAAGVAPLTGAAEDIEIMILCEHFELFQIMAANAGPNPTRRGMAENIGSVGTFRGTTIYESHFNRPGKYTGGDVIKLSVWKRSCSCWHPATKYFKAFA